MHLITRFVPSPTSAVLAVICLYLQYCLLVDKIAVKRIAVRKKPTLESIIAARCTQLQRLQRRAVNRAFYRDSPGVALLDVFSRFSLQLRRVDQITA